MNGDHFQTRSSNGMEMQYNCGFIRRQNYYLIDQILAEEKQNLDANQPVAGSELRIPSKASPHMLKLIHNGFRLTTTACNLKFLHCQLDQIMDSRA